MDNKSNENLMENQNQTNSIKNETDITFHLIDFDWEKQNKFKANKK